MGIADSKPAIPINIWEDLYSNIFIGVYRLF